MNELKIDIIEKELTGKVIKAFYNVYNKLGFGFLEKVYECALVIELNDLCLQCEVQKPIRFNLLNQLNPSAIKRYE